MEIIFLCLALIVGALVFWIFSIERKIRYIDRYIRRLTCSEEKFYARKNNGRDDKNTS
jgi:hypothetical protein